MKVLVIDDSESNRSSAIAQLSEKHQLTVVGTSYEAAEEIRKGYDAVLTDLFMPVTSPGGAPKRGNEGFDAFGKGAAVLVGDFYGKESPVGFGFALLAGLHSTPYIAVITDTDHHNDPVAAQIDWFGSPYNHEDVPLARFELNGSKMLVGTNNYWASAFRGPGKRWDLALEVLLGADPVAVYERERERAMREGRRDI